MGQLIGAHSSVIEKRKKLRPGKIEIINNPALEIWKTSPS